MLTKKQYELLVFINQKLRKTGVSPSFDEMKEALALKSKSGIHRIITGLEERGFIKRMPHKARALEVIKLPENSSPRASESSSSNIIQGTFINKFRENSVQEEIPLLGKIAAGTPIEAISEPDEMVAIPMALSGSKESYALRVEGDSMVDVGINDGDTVIIEKCNTAENGTIVVALIDDNEATLKKIRIKGETIALEAANKNYETRIFGPDRVKVQGRLVGLFRYYH